MADGPPRKRPLDAQASVWVVMRSVTVPSGADWGQAPHMQVALSGVFATKEAAEQASAKHQKALAVFCEKQSKELRDGKKRTDLEEKYDCDFPAEGCEDAHFSSQLTVVEMPVLTESPSTEPEYKVEGKRVALSGAPNGGFKGPMADVDGYSVKIKPKSYCRIIGDEVDHEEEGEEDEEEDEDGDEEGEGDEEGQ